MHATLIFAVLVAQDPAASLAPAGEWPLASGAVLSARPGGDSASGSERHESQTQAHLLRKPGMRLRERTVLLRRGTALRVSSFKEVGAHADVLPVLQPYADRSLVTAQLDRSYGGYAAVLGLGNLRERSHLNGTLGRSALAPGSMHTRFAALSLKMPLNHSWSLIGTAWYGRRTGEIWEGSLQRMEGGASAFSATVAGQGLWTHDDRMTLALNLPRGSRSGPHMHGMLLARADGSFTYALRPMSPWAAPRTDLELGYARPLGLRTTVTGAARLPMRGRDGDAGAAGLQLGLHLNHRF